MASVFDYIFNIGGNFTNTINGMTDATGRFTGQVEGARDRITGLASVLGSFDYAKNIAQSIADGFNQLSSAGVTLDSQMHDLSAVAGATGDGLKQIETFARQSAKAFGTDAAVAVEGYKLLLSQLSPELGKYPDALSAMGDCIQTTSKLMGGDGVAAAQVLTTAMNQYGVSMEDPIAASEEMARMMNVMAAAGQAGSAELPAISAALQQCGMAAKAANVSFEETNAAIQVLDKAGKKASEGGVALRNVLGQLSKGRFVEKQASEELEKAGIDIVALGDNSKSLKERLEMLKPMLNDSALLSKFFGVENANAARALIQGTDALQGFTDAVTGTNSATEQAAVVMDSYAERQAQVNQKIEDYKITIFQATGDFSLWCGVLTTALVPIAQLSPLLTLIWKALALIKLINPKKIFEDISNAAGVCRNRVVSLTIGTQMLAISFGGFKAMGVTACRAVGSAIKSIPFFWIATAIGLIMEGIKLLWDNCKGFRVFVFTALELFKRLGELIVKALQKAWIWIVSLLSKTSEWITGAINWIVGAYDSVVNFFSSMWSTIMQGIEWIREKFTAFVNLISSVFSTVYSTVVGFAVKIWDKISDVIDRIRAKISGFLSPILDACKSAYDAIKDWFGSLFSWIDGKINSVIDWFVDIYNKLAAVLGWEEIKARGQARADESWAKDHPRKGVPSGKKLASVEAGEVPEVTVPNVNPTGTTLSGASGTGGKGSGSDGGGRIRNITINIDKLVERFEIHSATVSESSEKVKEVILETLMGALNDTQLTMS